MWKSWIVEVMDWPSKCPDISPIEHIWDQMVVHNCDMNNPPATLAQLCVAVQQVWGAPRPVVVIGGTEHVASSAFYPHRAWRSYPLLTQPLMLPWNPFGDLQNLKKIIMSAVFLLRTLFIDTYYSGTPWLHCTLPASARKSLTLGLLVLVTFGVSSSSDK